MYGKRILLISLIALIYRIASGEITDTTKIIDYSNPKEYTVDTVIITGVSFIDKTVLANMSGFDRGSKITLPGDDIKNIIVKYWEQGLFEDVQVSATMLPENKVALNIYLKERPRLSTINIEGVGKSDRDDLKEKLNMRPGSQVTENILNNIKTIIKKFYAEKGFYNTQVNITQKVDTARSNRVALKINITKNKRVKIKDIYIAGNKEIPERKLLSSMKKTKKRDWKFWNSSKFIEAEYKADKIKLIDFYNEKGFRDAKILSDSLSFISNKRVKLYLNVYEGDKYYFRNVAWIGNTKYPSEILDKVLGIKKGAIFNQKYLDKRLSSDEDAVSSLYMDNGYLFFNVDPVEVAVDHDSIDFEMRIREGDQATLNNILISGNTKTNEHVVRRELRTYPGELFSRSDLIRSVREIANLGHFEPEKIDPGVIPNQGNGTVDLNYKLVERANDQLEVSGGWGMGRFIGTVGVKFNNFSYRNFFDLKEWRPVPSGDGQSLALRLQSNGTYYRTYSISFADPWFGGKKPLSLSASLYYSRLTSSSTSIYDTNPDRYMKNTGLSLGLGKRLKWPDDYFQIYYGINFERYNLKKWSFPIISDGSMNNFNFTITLGRNSQDQPIYPRVGSNYSLSLQFTPPYSFFNNKNYNNPDLKPEERFGWLEYHKWHFKSENYLSLVGNLVLMTRANFGFLGRYTKAVGYSPIGRFQLGGSGMATFSYTDVEIISLRGYEDASLEPNVDVNNNLLPAGVSGYGGGNLYDKFTAEVRYPVILKEQSTIYGLVFAEAGNSWNKFEYFNPFNVKRSVGLGVRVFLPMFGLLGFDWGYGFDPAYGRTEKSGGQFHFTMGQNF
jgi:outer membrane protein insertion porin family